MVIRECPEHHVPLTYTRTKFGLRGACPVPECTVVGWDSPTSTPADLATRRARRQCHVAFDALWRGQYAEMARGQAYEWLAAFTERTPGTAHIGMMSAAEADSVRMAVWAETPGEWLRAT